MVRPLVRAAALLVCTLPAPSYPAPPAPGEPAGGSWRGAVAEGRVESAEGRLELLGRPLRAGDRIDLPEGYLIVEEDGPEDGQVGSFAVVPAASLAAAAGMPAPAWAGAGAGDPAPAPSGPALCAAERSAYLAELWRGSGVEVTDPAALLEGLEGGATGPGTGFYWFALQADPFRPLAWSSALRARAEALARCVREGAPAPSIAMPSLAGR